MTDPIGYRLHSQDFRGRRLGMGDKAPPKLSQDYPTRAAAEAAQRAMREEAIADARQMAEDRLRGTSFGPEATLPPVRAELRDAAIAAAAEEIAADLVLSVAPIYLRQPKQSRRQVAAAWGDLLPLMRRSPREWP